MLNIQHELEHIRGSPTEAAERLAMDLHRDPGGIPALVRATSSPSLATRRLAYETLERLAHRSPELVSPHRMCLLRSDAISGPWEVRLQMVRALPLLHWTQLEEGRVLEILRHNARDPNAFVSCWATDAFSRIAAYRPDLGAEAELLVAELEHSQHRSHQARARAIRRRATVVMHR